MKSLLYRLKPYKNIIFFLSGIIFDLFTLVRIDRQLMLIQQALFLIFIAVLLHLEFQSLLGSRLPKWVKKYKTYALHFLMGSLLSAFVIFYFLSSSGLQSWLFVAIIALLLVVNELPQFRSLSLPFKVSLFSLCCISYLSYTLPILFGFIGLIPLLSTATLFALITIAMSSLLKKSTTNHLMIQKNLTLPALFTLSIFLTLYFAKIIPPVPLSIKKIGIYRSVEKINNQYHLSYRKPEWKFWLKGEQIFYFQTGDEVYCFVSIFSPTDFNDEIKFKWFLYSSQKWVLQDTIPLKISGGRNKGYRAYSFKSKVRSGQWRVKIVTHDDREIGRVSLDVKNGSSPFPILTEIY